MVADKDDPRVALAKWMTAPDNPYFARAWPTGSWAQLFGKGLVDPPDDMSRANPPVHPELLDALARHFIASKYDLRDLIRTIATSEAYGLSSGTVKGNERDSRLFSHQTPRPLTAHQMADALAQATDVPNTYGQLGPRLAIRVTDPATPSAILDTFGRCSRPTGCAPVQTPPLIAPPGPAADRRRRHREQGRQPERLPRQRPEAGARARRADRKPVSADDLPPAHARGDRWWHEQAAARSFRRLINLIYAC